MGKFEIRSFKPDQTADLPFLAGSMEEIEGREIIVYSANGQMLSRTNAYSVFQSAVRNGAKYPNAYVLLSEKGITASVNQGKQ